MMRSVAIIIAINLVALAGRAFAQTLMGNCTGTVTVQIVTANVYCTPSCSGVAGALKYSNPCAAKFHTGMLQ